MFLLRDIPEENYKFHNKQQVLKKYANNIWFYWHIYLILITSVQIMREFGFSLTRILPYKDRIVDSAYIRENIGQ